MILLDFELFVGRFHPLLVHLPIGFLVMAFIIDITERFSYTKGLRIAIPFILLCGVLSAVLASVLGLLLANRGAYDPALLSNHKWAGIITTLITVLAYLIHSNRIKFRGGQTYSIALIIIGVSITGHLGGSLTHGSDYLTAYLPFTSKNKKELSRPQVTSLGEAQLFGDLIHPIVKTKCMSCHNNSKPKGQLSFASFKSYLKGGKHGKIISPSDALNSEILVRVNLDPDDEHFMPADGKTPLTEEEKQMLTYWVLNAEADFDTLFLATQPNEKMIKVANFLLHLSNEKTMTTLRLPSVSTNQIMMLKEKGFTLRELSVGSNAFDVVLSPFYKNQNSIHEKINALLAIQENVFWLTLEGTGLQNADLKTLANFKNVRILKLSKNDINDENISFLKTLTKLESLNLYQTNISTKSINELAGLPSLKRIYVWQTKVKKEELSSIRERNKHLEIIEGI